MEPHLLESGVWVGTDLRSPELLQALLSGSDHYILGRGLFAHNSWMFRIDREFLVRLFLPEVLLGLAVKCSCINDLDTKLREEIQILLDLVGGVDIWWSEDPAAENNGRCRHGWIEFCESLSLDLFRMLNVNHNGAACSVMVVQSMRRTLYLGASYPDLLLERAET